MIHLYIMAGPSPTDVAQQYAEVAETPGMMPYWGLVMFCIPLYSAAILILSDIDLISGCTTLADFRKASINATMGTVTNMLSWK